MRLSLHQRLDPLLPRQEICDESKIIFFRLAVYRRGGQQGGVLGHGVEIGVDANWFQLVPIDGRLISDCGPAMFHIREICS